MKEESFFSDPHVKLDEEHEISVWNREKVIIWLGLSMLGNFVAESCLNKINKEWSFIWAASLIVFIIICLPILVKGYLWEWETNIINLLRKKICTKFYNLFMLTILLLEFIYVMQIFYDRLLK